MAKGKFSGIEGSRLIAAPPDRGVAITRFG